MIRSKPNCSLLSVMITIIKIIIILLSIFSTLTNAFDAIDYATEIDYRMLNLLPKNVEYSKTNVNANYCRSEDCMAHYRSEEVIVQTEYGRIAGLQVTSNSTKANIFLGIPFAKPPIGDLRFEKPLPPDVWTGVRETKKFGASCVPIGYSAAKLHEHSNHFDEDCLYLNIIAPSNNTSYDRYPVLFFIHGGAFEVGNAFDFGYKFFAENYVKHGLIVVTIQYRLAHFGFASNGDKEFSGNYGMWDVHAALRYVKSNIRAFGGDINQITVWGHSAGSAIAGHITLSTHTRDLFHGAIQMGASCYGGWALNNRVVYDTFALAAELNCNYDPTVMKACLKEKSTHDILTAMERIGLTRNDVNFIKFSPRLDYDFFENDIATLLESAPAKPTVIGISDAEALLFTLFGVIRQIHEFYVSPDRFPTFKLGSFVKFIAESILQPNVNRNLIRNAELDLYTMIKTICEFYLTNATQHSPQSWNTIDSDERSEVFYFKQYTKIISDWIFVVPILLESQAKMLSNWPVYLYHISYARPDTFPDYMPIPSSMHGTEYPHLFGIDLITTADQFESNDIKFQSQLITMIETFAKRRKPSISIDNDLKWPALNMNSPFIHAELNTDVKIVESTAFFTETLKFWKFMKREFNFDATGQAGHVPSF